MKQSSSQSQDNEVFRNIFTDHWVSFCGQHPGYAQAQYEEPVEKMLRCGKESGGYSEYICMHCGRDFRRVRYFGLQATKPFKKWSEAIREGVQRIGRVVECAYQVVSSKSYWDRYKEVSGHDPMICRFCGCEMDLWQIWHPKYGIIYDEYENLKAGKYEPLPEREDGGGELPIPC